MNAKYQVKYFVKCTAAIFFQVCQTYEQKIKSSWKWCVCGYDNMCHQIRGEKPGELRLAVTVLPSCRGSHHSIAAAPSQEQEKKSSRRRRKKKSDWVAAIANSLSCCDNNNKSKHWDLCKAKILGKVLELIALVILHIIRRRRRKKNKSRVSVYFILCQWTTWLHVWMCEWKLKHFVSPL